MKKVTKKYQIMNQDELDEAWQVLTEREKTVILKRFGLNGEKAQTLETTGKAIGLTREGTRRVQNKALTKLRLAGEQLQNFGRITFKTPVKKYTVLPQPPPTLPVKRKKKPIPLPVTLPPQPPVPKCSEKKRLNWLERWITGNGTAIRQSLDGITLFDATGGVKIHADNLRELIDRAIHGKVLPENK
jgi:hypothetical protein